MTTDPGSGNPTPPHEAGPPPPAAPPPGPAPQGDETTSDLLQTMLSKAVGDQVGDQREIASAVSDIRGRLVRLSQELAEMRVRPPQDEVGDAQMNTVTVEMREAVRFLSERLDGVTRMVAQRGEETADIRTALTAIDAHVRSQAETIGVLSAGLQALPSYGERVSVLQDNLQVLHRQLVGIEETLAAPAEDLQTGKRLTSIEAAVGPLAAKIDALGQGSGNQDELIAKLDALGHSGGNQDAVMAKLDALGDLSANHQALLARLDAVSDLGTAQSALLSQLQSSSSQIHQSVSNLHERVEPLATDVTAIGSGVTGLVEGSADGAALDARVTESIHSAMRDTEARLMAHVDEAVMALAETLLRQRRVTSVAMPLADSPIVDPRDVPPTLEPSDVPNPITTPTIMTTTPAYASPASSGDATGGAWWEQDAAAAEPPVEADVDDDPVPTDTSAEAEFDGPLVEADGDATEVVPAIPALDETGPLPFDPPPTGSPIEGVQPPAMTDDAPAPTDGSDAGEPWSPETPPERDPSDPTVSMEDKKRRRWGRN